jgi:hypothetical protein
MAELLIKADSEEEWDTLKRLASELTEYTGGWVHDGYADTVHRRRQPWSVTLNVPLASEEELKELWRRVRAGDAPGAAYEAVQGPRDELREWMQTAARPGRRTDSQSGTVEIKHKRTGEVLLRVEGAALEQAYLAGANLDEAGLARQNLTAAELQGARLICADLEGACLREADLRGVVLLYANLADANLENALLWGSCCLGANFSGANLRRADLRGADLTRADLFGGDLRDTRLSGIGLQYSRYDARTRWPDDFNPRQHGAALVGWFLKELPPESGTIDEEQAIEIARRAVAANETWTDGATYEATREDDLWSVHVWRIDGYGPDGEPLWTFGGDRSVEIEPNGRVVRYMFGC